MPPITVRRLLPAVLLLAIACSDATGSGGDRPATIRPGTPVQAVLAAGGSDVYTLQGATGRVRLTLQTRTGSPSDTLVAELLDSSGAVLDLPVVSVGTDALPRQAADWYTPAAGRSYRVRVRGWSADDAGAYTLAIYLDDPGPERVPAALVLGQVVEGEAIDVGGDVDVFHLQGQEGMEVIAFLQAPPWQWSATTVEVVDSATGSVLGRAVVGYTTTALEEVSSGRLRLPRAGRYLVRVFNSSPNHFGPYRFRVDQIRRTPEGSPPGSLLGAVADEQIESVGDVDEFTFAASAGQEVTLMAQVVSGLADGLTVELRHGEAQLSALSLHGPTAALDDFATGRLKLTAGGTYTVRASSVVAGRPERATGRYRVEVYPVNRAPETGTLGLNGGPLSGAIDRPGDVDEYTFDGVAGQWLVASLRGPSPSGGMMIAELVRDGDAPREMVGMGEWRDGEEYSHPYILPLSGRYTLRIQGHPATPSVRGPYVTEVYTVSPSPEHVPAVVEVGQTVTGERIDRPGDEDVFILRGPTDDYVNIFIGTDETASFQLYMEGASSGIPQYTVSGTLALDRPSTGRIRLEDRLYTLRVTSTRSGAGAYAFRVMPIQRAPEVLGNRYVPGDTLRGESIHPAGDIDEYTVEIPARRQYRAYWRFDRAYGAPSTYVVAVLTHLASGENFWPDQGAVLDLPAGTYRLRVWAPNDNANPSSDWRPFITGPYEFAITPR